MILALALVLASTDATLPVKVVSLDFSYPYVGEPGNTCQGAGSVYLRAVSNSQPVVVRLNNASGLSPGTEAVLADVRRAGTGRDGTAVFCSSGVRAPEAPVAVQPVATETQPPMVAAAEPSKPAASRCTVQLFNVIKKPLGEKKFGPSEFDPQSAQNVPEEVDCGLARARNTNVLLVRMVKDGSAKPETVIGAEWGGTWQKEADAPQRRAVKVYLVETPAEGTAQR